MNEIIAEMAEVAEEVKIEPLLMKFTKDYNLDMLKAREFYQVLYEGSTANDTFRTLLKLEASTEQTSE